MITSKTTTMNKSILLITLSMFIFAHAKAGKNENMDRKHNEIASVERDKNTKAATLNVFVDGNWALYAGNTVATIDNANAVLTGNSKGKFLVKLKNDSVHYFFKFVTDKYDMILSEYHLPMEGGYNFRDLGGIKNKEGKSIKWGKVFRSDDLYNLTDADLKYLSSIPLITIVDFRSADEIKAAPDRLPSSVKVDYQCSISPGNLMQEKDEMKNFSAAKINEAMENLNKLLVTDSVAIDEYMKFFSLLQNESNLPLMFHCTAGKDRTGMGAALLMFALDVDKDIIVNEYMASNKFLGDKYALYVARNPNLKSIFEVKKNFLEAGLKLIEEKYGDINNFLIDVLHVDLEKLKSIYLY